MIAYSLSVAIIIAISVAFYRVFLHRETFFRLNRAVLLTCLVLAFIVPLVKVPAKFSFRPAPPSERIIDLQVNTAEAPAAATAQQAEVKTGVEKTTDVQSSIENKAFVFLTSAIKYIPFVYWAGVAIMGGNLLLQILVLLYRSRKNQVIKDGVCRIVEVDGDRAPCSFANRIFINPEKYDWETYDQILAHEKIHVLQAHTLDLILAELMLVFQWFNPLAWIYRKDIESNLEYLTDDSLLKETAFERSTYQLSLVKVSVPEFAMNITTNYNQSLLKKRIVMMNARRSNINGMWKYMTLVLMMAVLVCNINEPLSAAAVNTVAKNAIKSNQYRNVPALGTEQQSATLSSPKNNNAAIKRAESGLTAPAPIADTTHLLKFSNTSGRIETFYDGGTYKMPFPEDIVKADANFVTSVGSLGYAALSQIQMDSLKTAGVTPQFIKDMAALGYQDISYKMLCILTLARVTPDYIKSFSDLGYGHIKLAKITSFKFFNVEAAYIKSLQSVGLDIPLDAVTITKSRGLTAQYVQSFKDLGYNNLPYSRISMWKSQGIDANYIRGFNKIGFNNIPESTLSFLKSGKITPEYVADLKDKGVVFADLKKYMFLKNQK
nr:M56 family metallopeptidase [uncultured Mucilaginibacter sp.]